MPSKYVIRTFHDDGYYHTFNRGVAKMDIFLDKQDYKVFMYYLKVFLSPPELIDHDEPFYDYRRLSSYGKVSLLSFCLMPNHFHLFVIQTAESGVSFFMKSLSNAYTKYFNDKYDRVGPIFQGRYKSMEVLTDSYYQHISRYIHQNPIDLGVEPYGYDYSSYRYYVDESLGTPAWINTEKILGTFGSRQEYRRFMEQTRIKSKDILGNLAID
jgi:putative transposase